MSAGAGNIITGYSGIGVRVDSGSTGIAIEGNSIYGNGGLGIDLSADGITTNGVAPDSDAGADDEQNFPVLTSANSSGGTVAIVGNLTSAISSTYRVEFFASTSGDASNGEGERYLGFTNVTTNGAGVGSFTASLNGCVSAGQLVISATATDALGNTSEFAANIIGTITNTAPGLSGANNFTAISEDAIGNTGTLVSALISGKVTDGDPGALNGIAVTAVINANGTWQFSTNNGGSWTAFGSPSGSSARLLAADATTLVRFVPNANYNGTVVNGITFRAWDQTAGTVGSTADTSSNGGSTAFSGNTVSASVTVNSVNDAPLNVTPAAQVTGENMGLVFSSGNANQISVGDADAGLAAVKVTLSAMNGEIYLSGTGGRLSSLVTAWLTQP